MREFETDMRIAKMSPVTIGNRLELLARLCRHIEPTAILDATPDDLRSFQAQFRHRAPATIDIYTRHAQAFYRWAAVRGIIATDPSVDLIRPKVPKGRPHPIRPDDLKVLFACTFGALRIVFVLAVFAGLRRSEICRLQRRDIDIDGRVGTALIHGKGGKERVVPLLAPVVTELHQYGLPRRGYVVLDQGSRTTRSG